MSTITKLNPKIREDRRMRAAMVRDAAAVRDNLVLGSKMADEAHTIADFLAKVARSPYRTGARKNELFQAIARELNGVQLAGQS